MAQKMICDHCLREMTENFTQMTVQTVSVDGTTAEGEAARFEFHPRCYNALQGLIRQMQEQQEPPPLDPKSPPPVDQPVNANDPEVVIPDFANPPTDGTPEPVLPPDVATPSVDEPAAPAAPVDDAAPVRRPAV